MSRKFSSIGIALAVSALGVLAACTTQSSEGQTRGGVWADEGPLTWPPRPTELGITANDLRTRLYQIADDSMKGRAVASEGNFKTAEYMAAEFERLGLMPAGENGTYFQEIPYGSLGFDQTQTELTIAEGAVAVGADWTPMSPSAATGMSGVFSGQDIPVVFGGLWGDDGTILDPTMIEGKAVVFMAPPAPTPLAGGRGGGRGGRGRGGAQVRDLRAQEAGAALVLVVVSALAPNAVSVFDTRTGMLPTV